MLIHVPNTFTPDDDEYNPVFVPVLPEGIEVEDYTLYIFNRWGEILFESHDYQIGWDGSYHGETAKEGVYTWMIQLVGGPRREHLRFEGHVNLLR
jgi:gliding motility-associated-like protein